MILRRELILIIARAVAMICVLLIVAWVVGSIVHWWDEDDSSPTYQSATNGSCNIAVIPLQGQILMYGALSDEYDYPTTSGDAVIAAIHGAEMQDGIKGILLQIDSGGGSPAPSEAIMTALKRETLPTAAYIREQGTSGAYLAATGADTIIASNYADVGSIGISASYLDQSGKNAKDGLQFISLSSGPFKDSYNPDKPFTEAERTLAKRDLQILLDVLVGQIAQNRHLATSTVRKLADGSSMPASLALQNGLIDQVGDEETARAWFSEKIGEEAVLCVANIK